MCLRLQEIKQTGLFVKREICIEVAALVQCFDSFGADQRLCTFSVLIYIARLSSKSVSPI